MDERPSRARRRRREVQIGLGQAQGPGRQCRREMRRFVAAIVNIIYIMYDGRSIDSSLLRAEKMW
jgi:hypothetical protein